jgi:hypothetical protein
MYQYNNRDKWMSNSKKDIFSVNWKLNMINAEKMHFIYKTAYILYFPKTLWYGWCDIDYFNEVKDRDMKWCNHFKLLWLNHEKIYFSLMCREHLIMDILKKQIQTKDKTGVPVEPISKSIYIIPTNFFLLSRENVEWMKTIYNEKLNLYFKNNVSIYSDQTILLDIILSDINELNTRFVLLQQPHNFADDKYQFIRLLL